MIEISFVQRLQNITDITKHLVDRYQDTARARADATRIETELFESSSTSEDYQGRCEEFLYADRAHSEGVSENESEEVNSEAGLDVFNTDGPTLDKYIHCTFHADGQTSTIYKAKAPHLGVERTVVALKVMEPDHMQAPHHARKEARLLDKARSTYIVPLLESFWQPGGRFILVFPFLRQDLENLLRSDSLTKSQSKMVFEGLFNALAHIHSLGIIHRDVKPSNILLKSMRGPVYLIDFGISWSAEDSDSEPADKKITDVGTTCYRPPELLFGYRNYDTSLDIWAAGCVVAEMVRKNHYQLFDAGPIGSELGLIKSMFTTLGTPNQDTWPSSRNLPDWSKMRFQDFPAKSWSEILPGANDVATDLIKKLVCYEQTARLTAKEVLEHPFAQEMRAVKAK